MFIFKTKDPKMQSPIKSCIFSLTEVSSQFVTNLDSLLEENTVTVVSDAVLLGAGHSTLSLVRNYCFGGQQNSWRRSVDGKGAVRLVWWLLQHCF